MRDVRYVLFIVFVVCAHVKGRITQGSTPSGGPSGGICEFDTKQLMVETSRKNEYLGTEFETFTEAQWKGQYEATKLCYCSRVTILESKCRSLYFESARKKCLKSSELETWEYYKGVAQNDAAKEFVSEKLQNTYSEVAKCILREISAYTIQDVYRAHKTQTQS